MPLYPMRPNVRNQRRRTSMTARRPLHFDVSQHSSDASLLRFTTSRPCRRGRRSLPFTEPVTKPVRRHDVEYLPGGLAVLFDAEPRLVLVQTVRLELCEEQFAA